MTDNGNAKPTMLVFSIALNGYQWLYKDCLDSHKRYAQKIAADHVCITRPRFTAMGIECCWLKLLLLRQALKKGYQWVLFLDADALVQDNAPDIRHGRDEQLSIFMARGKTARFNSGVILVRNTIQARDFISQVLASQSLPLKSRYKVGWGENGYIIQAAAGNSAVGELSLKWNNTWQTHLPDYIRHFNHGIMRNQISLYPLFNIVHQTLARITRGTNTLIQIRNKWLPSPSVDTRLSDLFTRTQQQYPHYF